MNRHDGGPDSNYSNKRFCDKKAFYEAEAFRKKVTIITKIHLKILGFLKALQ